jgi:hypothetical protein
VTSERERSSRRDYRQVEDQQRRHLKEGRAAVETAERERSNRGNI